jgi:preprotein translocase subunit SecE
MSDIENKDSKKNLPPKTGRSARFKLLVNKIAGKFNELRGEFRKIVWPSRETLVKHTVTTIVISLIFGAFITVLDGLFGIIFQSLVGLMG